MLNKKEISNYCAKNKHVERVYYKRLTEFFRLVSASKSEKSVVVPLGTKMGPNYTNLFVGYVEQQIFKQYTGPFPDIFGRYIDDCL